MSTEFDKMVEEIYQKKLRAMAEAVAERKLRDATGLGAPAQQPVQQEFEWKSKRRKFVPRRYPHNSVLGLNSKPKSPPPVADSEAGRVLGVCKQLLSGGPAERTVLTKTVSSLMNGKKGISKYITVFLDRGYITIVGNTREHA